MTKLCFTLFAAEGHDPSPPLIETTTKNFSEQLFLFCLLDCLFRSELIEGPLPHFLSN